MTHFETVLMTPDLGPGRVVGVKAHGRMIALANAGQTYYAVDATCPDDGTDLAREGRLDGEILHCPRGHAFDLGDGSRVDDRARGGLRTYPIQVTGNQIRVGSPGS